MDRRLFSTSPHPISLTRISTFLLFLNIATYVQRMLGAVVDLFEMIVCELDTFLEGAFVVAV